MTSTVLIEALERELRLVKAKIRMYESRVKELERKYGISSNTFLDRFEKGELGDKEDFFLWWSYLRALSTLRKRVGELEEELQKLQGIH